MIIQQPSGIRRQFLLAKLHFCKWAIQPNWFGFYVTCIALLFVFANPAQSQSCATCKNETATVGFVASVCTHHDNYTVTLNGQTLIGSGSCAADLWVTTNKAYTQLTVDQTYVVTAGTDSCSTHIAFDVPDAFKLEINGVETTVIDKAGVTKGSGDGTWNVVLRKKCPSCGDKGAGESCKTEIGSVDWSVSMGRLSDGRSAQSINIFQDALAASIYTPSALIYSPPGLTNEVDVIRNGDLSLRQVKSTQALADVVVTIAGQEYEIRFYRPADVGAKVNGVYSLSGQPQIIWRIKNPEPSSNRKLQLSKIQGGLTEVSEYTRDVIANSWILTTGGGLSVKTKTITYPTASSRNETTIVREANGILVSKVIRTFRTFSWGEELVQEIVDPDGAALKTVYSYYEEAEDPGRYTKLKDASFPDGSWEKYDYDAIGNRTLVMRPWKDLTLGAATETNSYVTRYTYSNFDGVVISLYPRLISSVEEQIGGVTVSKTTYARSGLTVSGNPATREVQTVYTSPTLTQTKTTTTFHYSAESFYANRISSIEYPDGRSDTYVYERGNYIPNVDPSLSQFTVDTGGNTERETVIHGTAASPSGVAFKTTKETSIRDQSGRVVFQELYVYTGAGYERIGWTVLDYDDRGHVVMSRNHKGEVATWVWAGDQKTSETDASGIETTYTYDSLNRLKTKTKKGIAAGGGFPAQADVTTTLTYDADGRQIEDLVSSNGLSLRITRAYDIAGRLIQETDHAGLTTTYSYSNDGRTQTSVLPGGASEIRDSYLDSQSKSITGSAVVARYFDYGVNPDGTRYTLEFAGPAGLSSPRWIKTTSDWAGHLVSVERPSFTGVNIIEISTYNTLGQMQKVTTMSGATKLLADKLFEYDELDRKIRTGTDVNGDGVLTLASTDRISDSDSLFEKVGNDWFRVTTNKVYLTDNSSTPVIQSERERLNNFILNGTDQTTSEITVIDPAGNSTITTSTVDRAAKKQVTIVDTPVSNVNAVGVTINGLLQSTTPPKAQSATTYIYDALGRSVSVTNSRTGTTTSSYSATTGQLTATNDGAGTTLYDYYAPTQVNAGKLKAQTNAAGKKIYFNYNSRGQVVQSWGDTSYPVEYVYDSYGQRTELHTFRSGQNWAAVGWPSATTGAADMTKWIYQDATGLLLQKQDATLKGPVYTYDELGRLKTRLWARGITATYGYDANTGALRTITYSDSTPSISFTYDRGGRQSNISDAAGSRTRTLTATGELQTEQISGGILDGINVTVGYDNFLRRSSLQTSRGVNTLSSQSYGYDATSRLQSVTSGSQTATYTYYPGSSLLNTTTFTGGSSISRTYDSIGRLESITTVPAADVVQSYTYTYNNLNQRTRTTREDGSYWAYIYNARGELVSGKKYWSDNSVVWGAQNEYSFDNLGNRISVRNGGNQLGALRQSSYTTNSSNQYSQRNVSGAVDVTGTANTLATVSVNNQSTIRKNEYFYRELSVDNTNASSYQSINVVGARNNFGAGGEDAVTEKGGNVFLPAAVESYSYDDDGNLISDGRWNYTWDAENRLISMETIAGVPLAAKQRLEFSYSQAKRIQKKVFAWNSSSNSYELQSVRKFIYEGWDLAAEIDVNNNLVRSYVRDVSGLLFVNDPSNTYLAGNDGNDNITLLVNAGSGTTSAIYEYDPFGQTVKQLGAYATSNPFRFSSQYTDTETGLLYYGYRYYNPQIARWISRDPSEEAGGPNLYGFINNDAISNVDSLGLWKKIDEWKGLRDNYSGHVKAECGDSLSRLATLITGYASDWHLLGVPENVEPNQVVDIQELLKMLELRLRQSVVRAAYQFNAVGFPDAEHPGTRYLNNSAGLRRFFTPNNSAYIACQGATNLVFAKGLIDVLRRGEFDRLGYGTQPGGMPWTNQGVGEKDMKIGDQGWVQSYYDIQDDLIWAGENIIKLDENLYWAYPFSGQGGIDMSEIKKELTKGYRKLKGREPTGEMPGLGYNVNFLNVPFIAMEVFTLRGGKQ